jgi:hypothetical protein
MGFSQNVGMPLLRTSNQVLFSAQFISNVQRGNELLTSSAWVAVGVQIMTPSKAIDESANNSSMVAKY